MRTPIVLSILNSFIFTSIYSGRWNIRLTKMGHRDLFSSEIMNHFATSELSNTAIYPYTIKHLYYLLPISSSIL